MENGKGIEMGKNEIEIMKTEDLVKFKDLQDKIDARLKELSELNNRIQHMRDTGQAMIVDINKLEEQKRNIGKQP